MDNRSFRLLPTALLLAFGSISTRGATISEYAPVITTVTRTSPATANAGTQVALNYAVSVSTNPLLEITVRLQDPAGNPRQFTTDYQSLGTIVVPTTFDWPSGRYTVVAIVLVDNINRFTTYLRDGTVTTDVSQELQRYNTTAIYTAPTSHSLPMADLDFSLVTPTAGTAVSGRVSTDTTWTAAGSPYRVTEPLVIASGVKLTLQPGTRVIGAAQTIQVLGTFSAAGTAGNLVILDNVIIQPGSNTAAAPFRIDISYSELLGGALWPITPDNAYGSLTLSDSLVAYAGAQRMTIRYPVADTVIQRNVFYRCAGLTLGTGSGGSGNIVIRDNVFDEPWLALPAATGIRSDTDSVISCFDQSGGAITITGNSFIGIAAGNYALKLPVGTFATSLSAQNNYWGSLAVDRIALFVFDQHVSQFAPGTITYTPYLSEPDPLTPAVPSAPAFNLQPVAQSTLVNGSAAFTATVVSAGVPNFQWSKDGVAIAGATNATLVIPVATASDAGVYALAAADVTGRTTSSAAALTIGGTMPTVAAWLSNVSVRTAMQAGQDPVIVGVVTNGPRQILMRAAGPALIPFGVSAPLADPSLEFHLAGAPVVGNDDWDGSLAPLFGQVGAFGFVAGSKDAALLQVLNGSGSVHELATGSGVVLIEAYDASAAVGGTRLINVSARNAVGTGENVLTAGFAISGSGSKKLLVRGIGPRLADFAVTGALTDPKIDVFDGPGNKIASNDDWDASLAPVFRATGAFDLKSGSKDAALVVDLAAGTTYSVQVSSADGSPGVALIEVYEVP